MLSNNTLHIKTPAAQNSNKLPVVSSQSLLQGSKTVAIAHNGSVYQLRATKFGKLILTK